MSQKTTTPVSHDHKHMPHATHHYGVVEHAPSRLQLSVVLGVFLALVAGSVTVYAAS